MRKIRNLLDSLIDPSNKVWNFIVLWFCCMSVVCISMKSSTNGKVFIYPKEEYQNMKEEAEYFIENGRKKENSGYRIGNVYIDGTHLRMKLYGQNIYFLTDTTMKVIANNLGTEKQEVKMYYPKSQKEYLAIVMVPIICLGALIASIVYLVVLLLVFFLYEVFCIQRKIKKYQKKKKLRRI